MSKLKKIWKDPCCLLRKSIAMGIFNCLPDKSYLELIYYAHFGKKLDLENPKTFNEKVQWLKLYDRKPEYTTMVDKYEVKKYVAEKIGKEYIIPTIGVWDHVVDIDFESLPNQFVLKCTHDSGNVVICKDKSKFDTKKTKKKIEDSLKREYFFWGREWPYKNVKHRIIAEAYLEDETTQELRDYKWYCFNGIPQILAIFCNRTIGKTKVNYFDMNFNHLEFNWGYPHAVNPPKKPVNFDKMKQFAFILSKNIPLLRVDFYEANGNLYFGELTFYDGSGFDKMDPEWDEKIGSWICLPK